MLKYMDEIRQNAERRNQDGNEAIQQALTGATVVTKYNQKTYKVDRVDFNLSPETCFDNQGTHTRYRDYYKNRYNEAISNPNQPLLINKDRRTGNEVALIPELCQLTGLTDAMRADSRLMQDLAKIVHTDANAKIKEIKNLLEHFKTNEKCVEKQKLCRLKFNENQQELQSFKYNAGRLQMGLDESGTPNSFDIEQCATELDRKIQGKMFSQAPLKQWAIFHGDCDG